MKKEIIETIKIIEEKCSEFDEIQKYDSPQEPFIVGEFEEKKLKQALEFLEIKNKIWYCDGIHYAFGHRSRCHEYIVESIDEDIKNWIRVNKFDPKNFSFGRSSRCNIGSDFMEPDFMVADEQFESSVCDEEGNKFPTFVVEVSVSNEPLNVLEDEINRWISDQTTVQSGLGVMVFEERINQKRRMLLLFKSNKQISFTLNLEKISKILQNS